MTDSPGDTPNAALAGVRVLELAAAVSGPYTTRILAELGADVVKVEEPLHGDQCRNWGPFWEGQGCYFLDANNNKRSISSQP